MYDRFTLTQFYIWSNVTEASNNYFVVPWKIMLAANLTLSYYRWSCFGSSLIVVVELQSFKRRHLTNHYFVENISRNYLSLSSFHPRQKNGWINYIFTLGASFPFLRFKIMASFSNYPHCNKSLLTVWKWTSDVLWIIYGNFYIISVLIILL